MLGSRYIVRCLYYCSSAFILNFVGMNVRIESHNSNTCNCPSTSSRYATCQIWLLQSLWEGVVLGVVASVVIMFTKVLGFLIHSCSFLRMHFFVLLKIYLSVIHLFLAGLGLCCCVQAFSRCGE